MNEERINNNAKAKGATFRSGLPDLNTPKKYSAPLPILLSSRVRLNDEQRETLKTAWRQHQNNHLNQIPVSAATPGSTVRTETFYQPPAPLPGLSALVINDLITTRETIQLTTILNLSFALGVEVITKEAMQESFDNYWEFVSSEARRVYG